MHDLAWLINGSRTLPELQTEAVLRGVPSAGVRKEDLRAALVAHENTRAGITPPPPIPTPLPVVPPPPATPLSIVTASPLTGGTQGIMFTEVFQATGGIPGYTWTEVVGLPPFLTLNANGILSGTPAAAHVGNHAFIVRVTDSSGNHVEGNFTLSVAAAAVPVPPAPAPAPVLPPIEIDQVTSGLPPVARGEELDEVLTATGGTGAGYRNWQILGPAQAWITLDRRGRLVIEPPDTARLGLVDIDVQVEDGAGNVGTGTLTVDVIEPARTRNVRQFLPIAGIAAGVIAAGLLLFLFLPSVVASAWNHSYWGDSDNGDAQVRTGSNGNGQNGSGNNGSDNGANGNGQNGSGTKKLSFDGWTPPTPGDINAMPKTTIELANDNAWFHRVFNVRDFHAPDWGGADSWFVSLAKGPSTGGNWISHGNPGQIVFRGTSTNIGWCLGVLTTAQYKEQFMGSGNTPAGINVRIAPNSPVAVMGPSGLKTGTTSDAGDITIIMPNSGVITICVAYTTAAPTHESLVWWGPYDRSENINTIDAR